MGNDMTLKEFSSRGGLTTKKRHGKEHYQKLAKNMNESIKRKYGDDYYKRLSAAGVAARKKKKQAQAE